MFPSRYLPQLFAKNMQWLENKQSSILSAALIITVANIASSLAGLVRSRLLISYFFNSPSSQQAYEAALVAFQIPDMLFQLIVMGAVSATFIPLFAKVKERSETEAFKLASVVMTAMMLVFSLAAILIALFAEPLTHWRTGSAFTAEQVAIVVKLTRIMLVGQIFFAVSNILSSILQSYQRFIVPSISPILYNFGIVAGVFLLEPMLGIYSAGIGMCIGAFLHMIIQVPFVLKAGFRFKWSLDFSLPESKQLAKLIPPRFLTIATTEFQRIALGFFTTSLGNLSFVVLKHALDLMILPIRLFGIPIGQASLPFLSAESAKTDQRRFRTLLSQSLNQIAFFAFPAAILILILRVPFVRLVFGTKNFPWETTLLMAKALAIVALSIPAQAAVQLLVRSFHSLKDTITPLIITLITVATYMACAAGVIFFTDFGVLGLAASTGIVAVLEFGLFLFFLERRIPGFLDRQFLQSQLKIMAASFFMAVFLYLPFRILDELVFDTSRTIELLGLTVTTGTIGMLVYVYFAALFAIPELKIISTILDSIGFASRKIVAQNPELIVDTMDDDSA